MGDHHVLFYRGEENDVLRETFSEHFPNISSPQVAETAVAVKTLPELSTNQGIKPLFAISNIIMCPPHPFYHHDITMMIKTVKMKNDKNPAAEMDFLMEALIMSKFQHPNIVQFIGVCFEKHPR